MNQKNVVEIDEEAKVPAAKFRALLSIRSSARHVSREYRREGDTPTLRLGSENGFTMIWNE